MTWTILVVGGTYFQFQSWAISNGLAPLNKAEGTFYKAATGDVYKQAQLGYGHGRGSYDHVLRLSGVALTEAENGLYKHLNAMLNIEPAPSNKSEKSDKPQQTILMIGSRQAFDKWTKDVDQHYGVGQAPRPNVYIGADHVRYVSVTFERDWRALEEFHGYQLLPDAHTLGIDIAAIRQAHYKKGEGKGFPKYASPEGVICAKPSRFEQFSQLAEGPVFETKLFSVGDRNELVASGYALQAEGWSTLTAEGLGVAVKLGVLRQ